MLRTLTSGERRSKVERKEEAERGYSEPETLASSRGGECRVAYVKISFFSTQCPPDDNITR